MLKNTLILVLACLLALFFCAGSSLAAEANPLHVPRLTGEVTLDAKLNEPQWQAASKIILDFVTDPFENTQPEVTTQVLMFEDGQSLYLAFVAEDRTPDAIRARYADRDDVQEDDLVGIRLDTAGDGRLAYEFAVNPFGVQLDAIENEMNQQRNENWDAIWYSHGKITEQGYQVEMAIPLRLLNFTETTGSKHWAAEFFRIYPRKDKLRISNVPVDRNNACILCQFGKISGFADLTKGSDWQIVPTLVAARSRQRDVLAEEDWRYSDNQEVGLDVHWGITPEFSLQATLNPDFSQVEADAVQVSVNNPFALFFDETRPFFLENAEYFSTAFNLIYTRNISAPDYGAKFTGNTDQHTLGVFLANDENTTFLVPDNLGSEVARLDEKSTNFAARYRYDLSDDLSVGLITTAREAGNYHNYLYGLDSRYQLSERDSLRVQLVRSQTQYPDTLFRQFCEDDCARDEQLTPAILRTNQAEEFSGLAYWIEYDHNARDWFMYANHFALDEGFRADLGFESASDFSKSILGGGYIWYAEDSWWNEIEFSGDWDITHNDNGELIEREIQAEIEIQARYQSYFELEFVRRARVGLRHDPGNFSIDGNTSLFEEEIMIAEGGANLSADLGFSLAASYGDQIDFDNNRLGKRTRLAPELIWNLGEHLRIGSELTYVHLDVNDATLFTAKLADLRLGYHFDQRQFLRLILTYSNISRNQANYLSEVDATTRELGIQLLYSYKLNPLTKFVAGYSEIALERDQIGSLTSTEQSVFMKLSYAFL